MRLNVVSFFICLFVGIGQLGANAEVQQTGKESLVDFEQLKNDYHKLGDDWRKKRAFCIELIDRQVIEDGKQLPSVLKIFGKDVFVITGQPTATSECSASVHFERQPKSDGDVTRAKSFSGWYLHIESNRFGQIEVYYLSNRHK